MDATTLSRSLNRPSREEIRLGGRLSLPLPTLVLIGLGAFLVVLVFVSERYLVRAGLGDDGAMYAAWITGWQPDVPKMGLHGYSVQRLLPSMIIRQALLVLHQPLDAAHIVRAFQWLNAGSLLVALASWNRTTAELKLTRAGYLVGTTGMFVNFAVLKWIPFDPVLTDAMAFGLANLAVMLFFTRSTFALALVTALGSFVWPSFGVLGCTLLFFPRDPAPPDEEPGRSPNDRRAEDVLAAIVAASLTLLASQFRDYPAPNGVFPVSPSVFRLSCAMFALFVFFGLRPLLRIRFAWAQLMRRSHDVLASRALAIVVLVGSLRVMAWASSAPTTLLRQPANVTAQGFVVLTLYLGVQRPLLFLIAHAVFFGPLVVVAVIFWRDVCRLAFREGFAIPVLLALGLLMGLNSESRRVFAFVPLLLPIGCVVLGRVEWTLPRLAHLLTIALVSSRVWHTIPPVPGLDDPTLFAMIGPWMPNDYAVIHGLLAVLVGAWLYAVRQRPADAGAPRVWLTEEQLPSAD